MNGLQDREDILAVIETEFSHTKGITYLDHAGATLYSSAQLQAYLTDLGSHLYGNPHSQNPSSKLTADVIEQTRERVLNHFNTNLSEYDIVFTSGCTGALKLLAESFPWSACESVPQGNCSKVRYLPEASRDESNATTGSIFCYLEDNHTSVVGMRETAAASGATIVCATHANIVTNTNHTWDAADESTVHHLFAYPAQSNFCGRKYPLNWTELIPNRQLVFESLPPSPGTWWVALDAASFVATSSLDLSVYPAHFVAISFYKMFGFPTGLGALLVRRDCTGLLSKCYYGGGTVAASLSRERFHVSRSELHQQLEDGTVSFLDIVALSHGFDTLTRIGGGMEDISMHTFKLAQYLYSSLSRLHHDNSCPVVVLYSQGNYSDPSLQGPIVNFNVLRSDGRLVGYSQVDKLACVYNIHLRTGCFCNTGSCMGYLGVSAERVKEHLKAGHVCGDSVDLVGGVPTGSVRVSLGYVSTLRDVQTFINFIETCFVERVTKSEVAATPSVALEEPSPLQPQCHMTSSEESDWLTVGDSVKATTKDEPERPVGQLTALTLYPVKSCAGQSVTSWPVSGCGLCYDRGWMVVGERGVALSLKQEPGLCRIRPTVDLASGTLTLTAAGHAPLVVAIDDDGRVCNHVTTRVCADRVTGLDCGDIASHWLTNVLNKSCRLVKQNPSIQRNSKRSISEFNERGSPLSLANEAQYLLVSESSVEHLSAAVQAGGGPELNNLSTRFRANLVVGPSLFAGESLEPYAEENWTNVTIKKTTFKVVGGCGRCQVVCVDPLGGGRSSEPLKTLMSLRGSKVLFGIYLTREH